MGIYDQLANLDKTPPVTSLESPKTAEVDPVASTQPTLPKVARKTRTSCHKTDSDRLEHATQRPRTRQRVISRVSLEIYQDQYAILKQVSLSAKLEGDNLSMSEMAREALDSYLTSKYLKL